MRAFPANSIRAGRLLRLHYRPDIRLQPDLNASINYRLLNGRRPYKTYALLAGVEDSEQPEKDSSSCQNPAPSPAT